MAAVFHLKALRCAVAALASLGLCASGLAAGPAAVSALTNMSVAAHDSMAKKSRSAPGFTRLYHWAMVPMIGFTPADSGMSYAAPMSVPLAASPAWARNFFPYAWAP